MGFPENPPLALGKYRTFLWNQKSCQEYSLIGWNEVTDLIIITQWLHNKKVWGWIPASRGVCMFALHQAPVPTPPVSLPLVKLWFILIGGRPHIALLRLALSRRAQCTVVSFLSSFEIFSLRPIYGPPPGDGVILGCQCFHCVSLHTRPMDSIKTRWTIFQCVRLFLF